MRRASRRRRNAPAGHAHAGRGNALQPQAGPAENNGGMSLPLPAPPRSALPLDSSAPFSAVVVDDDAPVRGLLATLLRTLGLEVRACGSADEAWALLEARPADLLVCDWLMPGMSGLELVGQIRLSEHFPGLYVIMVTGLSAGSDRTAALESGADDFLSKPFDETELRVRVRAALRVVHLRRQLVERNRQLEASNRELNQELLKAGRLQRAIVDMGAHRVPGFEVAWAFHPLGQASGDMFGVFPLDETHAGVFLLDVSGHGMAAAMMSFAVSRLLSPVPGQDNLVKRRLPVPPYYEIVPPMEVLRPLRARFEQEGMDGLYFTLVYAVLDAATGALEWVSAGHPAPVLVHDGACARGDPPRGQTPVGLAIETRGDAIPNRRTLAPGDRVVFYSDGAVEVRDRGGAWLPEQTLEQALERTCGGCVHEWPAAVVEALRERSGRRTFDDDVTLVALERLRDWKPRARPAPPDAPRP